MVLVLVVVLGVSCTLATNPELEQSAAHLRILNKIGFVWEVTLNGEHLS